ncbi:hypothetical protein ACH0CA_01245 [Kytococcus sedentarius]|uniref:hypothetical protein n=1 Tax=Kytococcus sedentarius TaxID=1276 RepID=UPI003879A4B5
MSTLRAFLRDVPAWLWTLTLVGLAVATAFHMTTTPNGATFAAAGLTLAAVHTAPKDTP